MEADRSMPAASLRAPGGAGRLRLTVVVTDFPALSETFVLDQVIALIDAGHDVRIVASRRRAEASVHDEVATYGLLNLTTYLDLPSSRPAQAMLLVRALLRHRWRMVAGLARAARARARTGEPGGVFTLAARVLAFDVSGRPDAMLCHFGPNGAGTVRALDILGWRAPVVTFFHGYDIASLVRERGPHLYDHLFKTGAAFLPACTFFADRLRAMGCPPDRVLVQRMCVDPETLRATTPPPVKEGGPFTFVIVGRLVPKKGTLHVVRAFAAAFGRGTDREALMTIIGDGPSRPALEAESRGAHVSDRIVFTGSLPRGAVLAAIASADALIQASVTAPDGDMEASPVVISEAMALGKPVIATRHGGIPELVVDGETGFLVDEGDETALAAAMRRMCDNCDGAAALGQAGRRRLDEGLTARIWNATLLHRLTRLAAGRTAGP